jgi:hypothetical protein
MNFMQIKSPSNGEKLYLDICSTADQEHSIAIEVGGNAPLNCHMTTCTTRRPCYT